MGRCRIRTRKNLRLKKRQINNARKCQQTVLTLRIFTKTPTAFNLQFTAIGSVKFWLSRPRGKKKCFYIYIYICVQCIYVCIILQVYSIWILRKDLGAWPNILSTCSKVDQKSVQPTKSGIFIISNNLLSNKSLQRCHKNDGWNLAPDALMHPDWYRISATNSATICSFSALHISDIQRLPWIEQVKKMVSLTRDG